MKPKFISLFLAIFIAGWAMPTAWVHADDRSITIKPKEKRDLAVEEVKKGLDTALLNTKYHAIVIGNNNYKNLPKLKTAIADAKSVDEILKNQYGFETKLLIDATRKDILSTMNDFRKRLREKDNLLIYYAGHGTFEKAANKAYWLPVDAQADDNTDWIIVDDITSNIKIIASRHILIVSDSCYAGTMMRSVSTELSTPARDEFIKKMIERPSRTLMASGDNEPVADEGGSGHSVFADSFLRALKEADKGIFTAEELFHGRVKSSVAGKSDQVPQYSDIKNSGHDGGDFVFQLSKFKTESMADIKIPEIQIKEPPKGGFSLEELDKKAKQVEDNRAAWNDTLQKMKLAFNQVIEYEKRDITPDLKSAAWKQFSDAFTEDNPFSQEDETMRKKAQDRIEYHQGEKTRQKEQIVIAKIPEIDKMRQLPEWIEGDYWALIIGINEYANLSPDRQLQAAQPDAKAIADVLNKKYGFAKERMIELYDKQATKSEIIKRLRILAKTLGDKDNLLIYYAGHGEYENDTQLGWWIPSDAVLDDPTTFIGNEEVRGYLKAVKARHIYTIADSVFSESLVGGKTRSIGQLSEPAIKELYNDKSRLILTSGVLYPVPDKGKGNHSTFAFYLLRILERNENKYLIPQQIIAELQPLVSNEAQQTPKSAPIAGLGDEGGQFVFVLDVKRDH